MLTLTRHARSPSSHRSGATNTVCVLMDDAGRILAKEHGSGTNSYVRTKTTRSRSSLPSHSPSPPSPQLIGVPAVADILVDLTTKAKASAGLAPSTPLAAFGACMSGFLEAKPQAELVALLSQRDPDFAASYYIDNDSPGSIYTAAGAGGGSVIICGTGTMAQLLTASGSTVNCGGHGHMFGDEASAYSIAASAIRGIFRAGDNYSEDPERAVPDVSRARAAMLIYFKVASPEGMLEVFYKTFLKANVAGFARVLADLARDGDAFSQSVFAQAGKELGSMARTLAPHLLPAGAPPGPARVVDGFAIVCVGSVWKSWDLLAPTFIAAATAPFHSLPRSVVGWEEGGGAGSAVGVTARTAEERGHLRSFRLLRLKETSAVGSAWFAARRAGVNVPVDHGALAEVLYTHAG